MQLLLTLRTLFGVLNPTVESTPEPEGADAVRRAVDELGDITDQTFEVTLGEPTIEDIGGQFFSDPKVVVPIEEAPVGNPGALVFDVPAGREDAEGSQLWAFLSALHVDSLDDVDLVEGAVVPVRYAGGNPLVLWDQFLDDVEHERAEE